VLIPKNYQLKPSAVGSNKEYPSSNNIMLSNPVMPDSNLAENKKKHNRIKKMLQSLKDVMYY
jgi:hypothetical protein